MMKSFTRDETIMNKSIFFLAFLLAFSVHSKNDDEISVGSYGLHFNELGEVVNPDEYYTYLGAKDHYDGLNKSAINNFKRAASYGNTFAMHFVGLLYLQENDNVRGYAWLSLVPTNKGPYAEKTSALLDKLNQTLSPDELSRAEELKAKLLETYDVANTFERRLAWSKDFKLTGTHLKGRVPNHLAIITTPQIGYGNVGNMTVSNASSETLKKSLRNFVYEYKLDFRLQDGLVEQGEIKIQDTEEKKSTDQ